jgi:hypothetical protein
MKTRTFFLGVGLALSVTTLFGLSRYDRGGPTRVAHEGRYFGLYYASSGMEDGDRHSGIIFCQMQDGVSPPVFCVTEN